jgi:hypothetical protein
MPSGLVVLAAYNTEDLFLVGNPEISHFRSVYRHHSPFATEFRKVNFETRVAFGQDTVAVDFPRDGDLIKSVWLRIKLPDLGEYGWTNNIGHAIIKEARLRAGETILDRQTGEWMNLWGSLTVPASRQDAYNELVGRNSAIVPEFSSISGPLDLMVPLDFWFCRHPQTAFPLVALQSQHLRLEIDIRKLENLIIPAPECGTVVPGLYNLDMTLLVEYVYLDRDEVRWFVDRPQVYLIEQVQRTFTTEGCGGANLIRKELPFNGLMKEIYFLPRYRERSRENLWFYYSGQAPDISGGGTVLSGTSGTIASSHMDIIESAKILYDTHEIVPELPAKFFRVLQPFYHHTRAPDDFIYCYSWAIKPEEWQPSGHINTFRATNMTLVLKKQRETIPYPTETTVYALVYNILKISRGVCGLEFQFA